MAGDWIKMRHGLASEPEVIGIAARVGIDEDAVVGKLHKFWSWGDTHTVDGHARSVTVAWLDRYVGVTGFADAMIAEGWLERTDDGLRIPAFEAHISESAKARALTANRSAKKRRAQRDERNADGVTKSAPREEKRREESKEHTPLPPTSEFDDHAERDEPDWLIVEAEFIARWNALDGVATHHGSSFELVPELAREFRRKWRDPGWVERADAAMKKFPLQNGVTIGLKKFLTSTTIDDILGGVHDFTRGKSRRGTDPTRVQSASTDADFDSLAQRFAGEPAGSA